MAESVPLRRQKAEFFTELFHTESDRACVVLAGAMFDEVLGVLLRARLVPIEGNKDPLFDDANSPLSSFSAKIEMGYRVGIVDADTRRALHLVRKIRNAFAHDVVGCTFQESNVQQRVRELADTESFPKKKKPSSKLASGFRGEFQYTVTWMLWSLWHLTENIQQIGAESAYIEELG